MMVRIELQIACYQWFSCALHSPETVDSSIGQLIEGLCQLIEGSVSEEVIINLSHLTELSIFKC